MSALPPKADIDRARWNVRFVPKADIARLRTRCQKVDNHLERLSQRHDLFRASWCLPPYRLRTTKFRLRCNRQQARHHQSRLPATIAITGPRWNLMQVKHPNRTPCSPKCTLWGVNWRVAMTRLIALAFALTLASFAQAMPLAPLNQQDKMVITVREACGPGMHNVGGACVRTHARRAVSRCARGVTC
jgi:hypothetical protein